MKKLVVLLLALAMVLSLFAGCSQEANNSNESLNSSQSEDSSNSTTTKEISRACTFDPPTLDPHNTVEENAIKIISLCNEGLVRNRNGEIVPGIAESWEISDDGYEYTFHLRESTWADGTPLTAYDFEYALLRVIDPTTAYEQAEFAYDLMENAMEYHSGEITDPSEVGVKALDEYTLYIKTDIPGIEILNTLSRYPWVPIKKEVAEQYGVAYGAEAENLLTNGPFKVVSWAHQDRIVLEKNENYWDKDSINLDRITFIVTTDDLTSADMMLAGSLDYMSTTNSDIMQQLVDAGFEMTSYTSSLQSLVFGGDGSEIEEYFDNTNFKQALNLAINRKAITDTLFTGGIPANRISTPSTMGVNGPFIEEYPYDGWPVEGDPERAKELLDLALEELGKTPDDIPPIDILCYESANTLLVIQAVQDMLLTTLGIEVVIDQLPIQQMFSKVFSGDYDLWWSGMAVGTMDWGSPDSFLSSLDWRKPSYTGSWRDEDFIKYYDIVRTTTDIKERKDSLFEIEKILINENPPLILVAYTQQFILYRPDLTGPEMVGFDDITYMDIQ